ncbi:hypothetical protein [Nocardia transvalensis]|uniref:hypothetical protein n=1 Tax=Nocardia transvalensis TaxID=37333 RepID=UPI0018934DA4|nr:hypothetical protein [Nocardia transvalensis]MBF6331441.1 hypothetical protein [Nocardia transvalensis]
MITGRRSLGSCAIVAVLAAVALGGCEKAQEVTNKGGDTPCSEFVQQDNGKQHVTVRKYLEQDNKTTSAPNDQTVDRAVTAIGLMCKAQSNPDTPIRNADLTGILVPR